MVPRKEMEGELKAQEKELADDIASLQKKVRMFWNNTNPLLNDNQSKYLEKQFNDAQAQLRDIVGHRWSSLVLCLRISSSIMPPSNNDKWNIASLYSLCLYQYTLAFLSCVQTIYNGISNEDTAIMFEACPACRKFKVRIVSGVYCVSLPDHGLVEHLTLQCI